MRAMIALAGLMTMTIAIASDAGAQQRTGLRVIRPHDAPPIIREDSEDQKSGRTVHRRPISIERTGATLLDVSFNRYAVGVGTDAPYAYNKEEVCYFASGEAEFESDGVKLVARGGDLMWRPAGATTERTKVLKDTITICTFAPARADGWSHRLSQAEIGPVRDPKKTRPQVRFYNVRYFASAPCEDCGGGVVRRDLLLRERDGTGRTEAVYLEFAQGGYRTSAAIQDDEICWVETGSFRVDTGGGQTTAVAHDFIHRPRGIRLSRVEAVTAGKLLCFYGLAD